MPCISFLISGETNSNSTAAPASNPDRWLPTASERNQSRLRRADATQGFEGFSLVWTWRPMDGGLIPMRWSASLPSFHWFFGGEAQQCDGSLPGYLMMKCRFGFLATLFLLVILLLPRTSFGMRHEIANGSLVFSIDDITGAYTLDNGDLHFGGRLPHGAFRVTKSAGGLRFPLTEGIVASVVPATGQPNALLFSWQVVDAVAASSPPAFPDFTVVPTRLHSLSHQQLILRRRSSMNRRMSRRRGCSSPRPVALSSSRLRRISSSQAC